MTSRLYLATPPQLATGSLLLESFRPRFEAALSGGDVAAVLLSTTGQEDSHNVLRALIDALRPAAQEAGAAFLLEGYAELAGETGCDGAQIPSGKQSLKRARDLLPEGAILGAACGQSRHEAMVAGEMGVDYVAFGRGGFDPHPADPDLLEWWQEMMLVPSVALGATSLAEAESQAEEGADFVLLCSAVWDDVEGPAAAVAWFNRQVTG
ncbi:thiamine phosphate synthase [Limibacillus halophilus]